MHWTDLIKMNQLTHFVRREKRIKNANATRRYRRLYSKKIQKLKLKIFVNLSNWKQQWIWAKFCNQIIAALEESSRKKFVLCVFVGLGRPVFYIDLRTYEILTLRTEEIIKAVMDENVDIIMGRL